VLVDGARVESAVIAAGGTAVVLSGAVASDVTVQSGGVLEVQEGAAVSGLDLQGGASLDFTNVASGASTSAMLSGTEIEVTIGGTVVARVGLTAATVTDLKAANAGGLTLTSDGHGGSALTMPGPALGNDTIDPGAGPDTVGTLGAATVFAGNASGFIGGVSGDRLAAGDTTIIGGGATLLGTGGDAGAPAGLDNFLGGSRPDTMGAAFPISAGDHGASPIPAPSPDSLHVTASDTTTVSGGDSAILHLADGTSLTLRGFPSLER
jgi:autotransporter passenger strand-loop-strand repeat protein